MTQDVKAAISKLVRSNPPIPEDALIMLDEALEAVPPGVRLNNWLVHNDPVPAPVLCTHRAQPGRDGGILAATWTLGLNGNEGLLEWWDDHWVMMMKSESESEPDRTWEIVWEGSRVAR